MASPSSPHTTVIVYKVDGWVEGGWLHRTSRMHRALHETVRYMLCLPESTNTDTHCPVGSRVVPSLDLYNNNNNNNNNTTTPCRNNLPLRGGAGSVWHTRTCNVGRQ